MKKDNNNTLLFFFIVTLVIVGFFYVLLNYQNQIMFSAQHNESTPKQIQPTTIPQLVDSNNIPTSQPKTYQKTEEMKNLDKQSSECIVKLKTELTQQQWYNLEQTAANCKKIILTYQTELNTLSAAGYEKIDELPLKYEIYSSQIINSYTDVLIYIAQENQARDQATKLQKFQLFMNSFDNMFTTLKLAKTQYPIEYSQQVSPQNEANFIEEYRQISLLIGNYLDKTIGPEAKYIDAIKPNAELVRTIVDKTQYLTNPGDLDSIKTTQLTILRESISYVHDPNWLTDWVQTPTLTLFREKGDCDDMAVLLASIFMRSGIPNVEFCFAASTPPYQNYDHAVVGVVENGTRYIYDPTCKNCTDSAPDDVTKWKINCYDINKYLRKYN